MMPRKYVSKGEVLAKMIDEGLIKIKNNKLIITDKFQKIIDEDLKKVRKARKKGVKWEDLLRFP